MEELCTWLDQIREQRLLGRIIKPSHFYKSYVFHSYCLDRNLSQELNEIHNSSTVYVALPPNCTQRRVLIEILKRLGCQSSKKETSSILRCRMEHLFIKLSVDMLILDNVDFQNADFLSIAKDIYEQMNIACVLVGTSALNALIRLNRK